MQTQDVRILLLENRLQLPHLPVLQVIGARGIQQRIGAGPIKDQENTTIRFYIVNYISTRVKTPISSSWDMTSSKPTCSL